MKNFFFSAIRFWDKKITSCCVQILPITGNKKNQTRNSQISEHQQSKIIKKQNIFEFKSQRIIAEYTTVP